MGDRAPFAAMSADPAVMRYLRALPTREACDAWVDYQIAHQNDHGFCLWAVELRESGAFVGAVGLLKVGFSASFTPAVEIGWRLAREAWGQGLATEAARRVLAFGFTDLGLDEIVAYAASANQASQNVMRKLGMMRDAASDFDHPRLVEGDPLRRHALYRFARADWQQPEPCCGLSLGMTRSPPTDATTSSAAIWRGQRESFAGGSSNRQALRHTVSSVQPSAENSSARSGASSAAKNSSS